MSAYSECEAANPSPTAGPSGHIQWKGTSVCIDLRCACGHAEHVDGEFVYAFRCPACGAVYGLSPVIVLVPLSTEAAAELGYATWPKGMVPPGGRAQEDPP